MKKHLPAIGTLIRFPRTKYLEIILAVGLFILLDTGVLIVNFYTSYQIANDAHAIKLASRMGTLTQSILQQLYQVRDDAMNPDVDPYETVDVFAKSFKTFDETLDSFIYGGSLIGEGQGQDVLLEDTTYRDTDANLLKEAEAIWKEYRVKLKPIVYAYYNDAEREDIVADSNEAITYARMHNDKLLSLMEGFSVAVEGVARRKAERLRMIQTIGISLAIINFFLILFHFLRKLSQSDALVEKSRKDTEDILQNVNEGLFLLDEDLVIGPQHSNSLYALFEQESFEDKKFLDLLSPLVTEKTLSLVENYTEVLFSPRVDDSLITDLNPLKEVEIHLETDGPEFDIRYFSFQFSRVYEKHTFRHLLVTVKDITKQVELTERLKVAKEKASREIDMLLSIMQVDGAAPLKEFLETTSHGLKSVNQILKSPATSAAGLKNKIETISRIIHKLKGDSTAIGIDFIEEKLNHYEEVIAPLKEMANVSGEDFLPLVIHLNQLMSDFKTVRALHDKIVQNTPSQTSGAKIPDIAALPEGAASPSEQKARLSAQFSRLVTRIADHCRKEAALDLDKFDVSALHPELQTVVGDIIVQCLRNAVVHGLENPETRRKLGKSSRGKISVAAIQDGSETRLTIRDDGRGIDLEKIKQKAVQSGLLTEAQLGGLKPSKLVSLIFKPGFTTSGQAGKHAGRGVGLDLIKSRLDSIGGKVRVAYRPGQYTEFSFIFSNSVLLAKSA